MFESLHLLGAGLLTALQPTNLLFSFIGCTLGTLIGVMPGLGPVAGTAILLPVAANLGPIPAIIMLSAIYYGAMYGGTITSVLMNVPGEVASAVTCIDGHQMARNGRAGAALTIAALGSFFGGTVATMGLVLLASPLSSLGLKFGPPEFLGLIMIGLSLVVGMAGNSLLRTMISAIIGLFIAMIGIDPVQGAPRFTFGQLELLNGVNLASLAMGMFGVSEVLLNLERSTKIGSIIELTSLRITREELRRSIAPVLRGTGIGFFLGFIPGMNAVVPTIISYTVEKSVSRTPKKFGTGMIEGVAGPETANNAHANAALIPLFTLGIPGSPTIAILMGGFMMQGLTPGPFLFEQHPDIAWAVIASLYVGNVILLILNLPLVPLWVKIMKVPTPILMSFILLFCVIGVYSLDNDVFDVWVLLFFGVLGYLMRKLDFPIAPLVMTVVLGPLVEQSLRQSLEMSNGSFLIFTSHPLALALILVAVLIVCVSTWRIVSPVRGADSEV
jgi:putative tricarboxylic transport membrane protein